MAPPIPDRWIPYKACGKVIEGTRIICFKVPLRKQVQMGKSEIKEIWDIQALRETIPNLGAVIDLTNTSRYYDPRELQAAGILHQKILMPGRIIPPEYQVQLFMDTVDEFLGNDCVALRVRRARLGLSTADAIIGVHCTHGLNRTGYMVCRYMRDRLNIPAKTAIKRFEVARGYQIERANYIADLLGEKPPPAYTGKHTKVKPIDGEEIPDVDEDNDGDDLTTSNRIKYGERNSERCSNSKKKNEITNWRTEDRSSSSRSWNTGQSWSKSKNSSSKKRTDSERSFDFRDDPEENVAQIIQENKLKRKKEKRLAKKKNKKMKKGEVKALLKEAEIKTKKGRKMLKRKRRREAIKKSKIIKIDE